MNCKKIILVISACIFFGFSQAQETIPQFKKGERAAFVGNSITHGCHYHSYIWLYYMTRFPDRSITILNCGVGGDCVWDIEERVDQDVLSKNPTYISLTFGMNDSGYYDFWKDDAQEIAKRQVQKSFDSYQNIEKKLQNDKGATKVLIGGSPYDETSKIENQVFPTKNEALLKINDFQYAAAEKNGWGFVDFNRPMTEINQREQKKDSLFTLCGGDRIHPDNDGSMVMAYLFLKAQGLSGEKVAEVSIDASNTKVEVAENCKVSGLNKSGNKLEFDYLAKALPYPTDTIARGWGKSKTQHSALRLIPFIQDFNQEILQVKNLKEGVYDLLIDGLHIADVKASDLQDGFNLALMTTTPQYQQATKIMLLNEERFNIEKRLRDYAWMEFSFLQGKGLLFADNQASIDTIRANWDNPFVRGNFGIYEQAQYPEIRKIWQDEMDGIVKAIYSINKPVSHRIELVRK